MSTSIPGPFFSTATPVDHAPDNGSSLNGCFENLSVNDLHEFFEVESTVEWIKKRNHHRIALQFPDSLLPFSEKVSKMIEGKVNEGETSGVARKTFVLADTSYRSCCVDEVAAAHASCTALIHYGEACHSAPTDNIDVKFVLGNMPTFVDNFKTQLEGMTDQLTSEHVVLLMDSCYAHEQEKVADVIKEVIGTSRKLECASMPSEESLKTSRSNVYLGRDVPACLRNNLATDLIFCGFQNTPLLPIWLLSYPTCVTVAHYDPKEKTMQNERLK